MPEIIQPNEWYINRTNNRLEVFAYEGKFWKVKDSTMEIGKYTVCVLQGEVTQNELNEKYKLFAILPYELCDIIVVVDF